MKATLSKNVRNLPQALGTGVEVHEFRTSIGLVLESDTFCGVAEISPQNRALNGDAAVDQVLEYLTQVALPRFLSVRERNLHYPHWAKVPTMFGNDAVSRMAGALIEGALYDGEVRTQSSCEVSSGPGIATASLIGTISLPRLTESVELVRIKVDSSVAPEAFDRLDALGRPVFLDYNGSCPSLEVVREQIALASVHVPVQFIEQLGRVGDFTAHQGYEGLGVPLSLDESLRSMQDLRNVERYKAASVVCVKPARVGGRAVARSIIEEALELGITPYVGGFFESALGRYANCELAADFGLGPSDTLLDSQPVTRSQFDAVRGEVLAGVWETVASF